MYELKHTPKTCHSPLHGEMARDFDGQHSCGLGSLCCPTLSLHQITYRRKFQFQMELWILGFSCDPLAYSFFPLHHHTISIFSAFTSIASFLLRISPQMFMTMIMVLPRWWFRYPCHQPSFFQHVLVLLVIYDPSWLYSALVNAAPVAL